MTLRIQRRLAAKTLKCGENRVWVNPDELAEAENAVTRADLRKRVGSVFLKKPEVGLSRGRARKKAEQKKKGRRRGTGSRKGAKNARNPRKRKWISTIRAIRKELNTLKEEGKIERSTYRRYYSLSKGGMFKSRAHLRTQLNIAGLIKEEK